MRVRKKDSPVFARLFPSECRSLSFMQRRVKEFMYNEASKDNNFPEFQKVRMEYTWESRELCYYFSKLPSLSMAPLGASIMSHYFPRTKILLLLRHPVHNVWSSYGLILFP